MAVKIQSAFGIGVAAAVAATVAMAVLRALDVTALNLCLINGALLTQAVGPGTWFIGFVLHLLAGGVIAVGYAAVFERWGGAGWRRGAVLSLPHLLVAGLLLWALPWLHPAVPEHPALLEPRFMAAGYGVAAALVFVAMHVLYGVVVGAGYQVPPRLAGAARRSAMSHGPA